MLSAAKLIKSYGIDFVDISFDDYDENAKEILKEAKLNVACMHNNFDFTKSLKEISDELSKAYRMVDTAAELKLKNILVVPGFVRGDTDYNTARENIAAALNLLCEYAEKKQVDIMLEDFDGDFAPYHTTEELLWLLDRVKSAKIAFDTGNFRYSDEDELEALNKLIDKVVYLHLKDRSDVKNPSEPQKTISGEDMYACPVGGGYIRIETVLKKLLNAGYRGDVVIEHFGAYDQLLFAQKSAEYLKKLIKR